MRLASTRSTAALVSLIAFGMGVLCASESVYGQANAASKLVNSGALLGASADFPDPFVLREGNSYYAFATGAQGQHIQAAVSTDALAWARLPDALPLLPAWSSKATQLTWSPSILKRTGGYVLYYTTRDARSGFQCISRGVAAQPAGPYSDDSTGPLVCQVSGTDAHCGSIDPSPFVDSDGVAYLYWKSDENSAACRTAPRVWVQRLTEDGLRLTGAATPVLAMDRGWEGNIIEGPSMLAHDGSYYLFYSANWYASANYAVGYATCRTPTGPCQKITIDEPWLKSVGSALGPGGQEFFRDAAGTAYMVYHAWTAPSTTYAAGSVRALRVETIAFAGGNPQIGGLPQAAKE